MISGYLITGILTRELADGHFSIWRFYERRVRRIVPALLLVMVVCTPAAFLVMLPDEFENYGQSLVATTFFANNILLWMTSGYFEAAAAFKPLMHTWSLAIEEQYYLLAPLCMLLVFQRSGLRGIGIVTATVVLGSFAIGIWLSRVDAVASYLMLPTRAWELGCGGLAAMSEKRIRNYTSEWPRIGPGVAWVGLGLLLVPLAAYDIELSSPGWPTLIPVLGTCAVLLFTHASAMPGRLLALGPVVCLGLISYSAYLFHQPVFAFARLVSLEPPSYEILLALVPLIMLFAWVSWRYVELPFRSSSRVPALQAGLVLGVPLALSVVVGVAIHVSSGLYGRWPELDGQDSGFNMRMNAAYNFHPMEFLNRPFTQNGSKRKLLVIGNSYARDFINMTTESGHASGLEISYVEAEQCEDVRQSPGQAETISRADFVVLGSGTDRANRSCTLERLQELRRLTKAKLIALGVKNFGWNNNAVMLLPEAVRYSHRTRPLAEIAPNIVFEANEVQDAQYVDLLGMITDTHGRVPIFTPERKLISQDGNHLTKAGAGYLGAIIFRNPVLAEITKVQVSGVAGSNTP